MNFPQEFRYGPAILELEGTKITRRRDGLDAGVLRIITPNYLDYPPGSIVDGYGLEVEESESEQDGLTDVIHTLRVVGVYGARPERRLLGYPQINETLVGFDQISDSIITTNPDNYGRGSVHATYGSMICVDSPRVNLWRNWWKVDPHYQGLIGSKTYKRQITVNEEVVSPQQEIVVSLPGGWSTPRKAQASLPKIMVRDTNVTLVDSPTDSIPGNSTPDSPPAIAGISLSGTGLVFRWPWAWKLASLDRDAIPGTSIALETLSYEFVWEAVFG